MNRLSLIALISVGLVACGDRATPFGSEGPLVIDRGPAAPLAVALDSASVQIEVGETLDLGMSISGREPDATVALACTSSDPAAVEVSASSALRTCRVTGLDVGSSTVTATVSSEGESASSEATVTVLDETFGN